MDKDIFENALEIELLRLEAEIGLVNALIYKYANKYSIQDCPLADDHRIVKVLKWDSNSYEDKCPLCGKKLDLY